MISVLLVVKLDIELSVMLVSKTAEILRVNVVGVLSDLIIEVVVKQY